MEHLNGSLLSESNCFWYIASILLFVTVIIFIFILFCWRRHQSDNLVSVQIPTASPATADNKCPAVKALHLQVAPAPKTVRSSSVELLLLMRQYVLNATEYAVQCRLSRKP